MLTVLIPSYNHEAYVLECLEAAVLINIPRLKVLIIDDGSTDGTARVIEEYIAGYQGAADVRLIKKKNEGLTSSLNMGLSLADTEYFYLVASDDVPDSEGIIKCVNTLIESDELKFIIGGAQYYDGEKSIGLVYGEEHLNFFEMNSKEREENLFLNYPQPILLQSTVFRTSSLLEVNGWGVDVISDDYQMFVKLLRRFPEYGKDFLFLPKKNVVLYRIHSLNSHADIIRQFKMIYQLTYTECDEALKYKAIGQLSAQYLLISIKKLNIYAFMKIVSITPSRSWGWLTWYIPKILFNYLMSIKLGRS